MYTGRFLNQFYFAQLVHAPEFPLFLEVGLGVVAAVVVAGLVVVAVHFARRRVRTSKSVKSDSMADPLLAVRTASGARVLDKEYKKRLLIPFGRLTVRNDGHAFANNCASDRCLERSVHRQ